MRFWISHFTKDLFRNNHKQLIAAKRTDNKQNKKENA